MTKRLVSPLFIFVGFSYLCVRLGMQLTAGSLASWAVFAVETLVVVELATAIFIKSKISGSGKRNTNIKEFSATALIDARACSVEQLESSLYALQESVEFSSVHVFINDELGDDRNSKIVSISKFDKAESGDYSNKEYSGTHIVWVNPGDVVLGDMLSQSLIETESDVALAIPRAAIWSNEISNASYPQKNDDISNVATDYIMQNGNGIWSGETCIFDSSFFNSKVAKSLDNKSLFNLVNKSIIDSKSRITFLKTIGLEQHDMSSTARINNRVNQIRVGFKSLLSSPINKTAKFASFRYAYRPVRAIRTVTILIVAIAAVIRGQAPYPNENPWVLMTSLLFIASAFLAAKFALSSKFDDNTRIRNNFANIGSDLFSLVTRNQTIIGFANTFFVPAFAIAIAASLVARWLINFGDDTSSQQSAPAVLFGMATLGTLIYGLELVGFKQRRNTLRRIVNVNAKFGRRAIEIADLSPFDCGVISERPTDIGHQETITLSIPSEAGTKTITLDAKVVNCVKVGMSYRVGFVFESVSAENLETLTRFCTLTYPQYALRGFTTIPGDSAAKDITIAAKKRSVGKFTTIRNQSKKPLIRVAAILALFAVAAGNLPPYSGATAVTTTGAANTISGITFQDFNANGVRDPGATGAATDVNLAGIKVRATCDNNGTITTGTATTNAAGEFIISNVSGMCRVETFEGVPVGMKSSAAGLDSNTTVQFHRSGTANVMFGFHYPGEFCQNNPNVVVTCFGRGNVTVTAANKGSIVSNTWNSTSAWSDVARFGQVGTVYGLAYKSDSKDLFSSAYLRRKAGLGPLGIGGIYKQAMGTAGRPITQWLNLETVAQAHGETLGANPRPANQSAYDLAVNDEVTEEFVGRRGIGDIDISPDNKTLYATNLNTGSIYAIEITNPTNTRKISITGTISTSAGRVCSRTAQANDFRIFGLGVKGNGDVYVGAVCTAQSTQNHNDLQMYVFKFNPSSNATPVQVSKSALNFDRTKTVNPWQSRVSGTPMPDQLKYYNTTVRWEPWQAKQQTRFVSTTTEIYPYPSVSDITFDGNDLIVGMRDIYSDTVPPNGVPVPGSLNLWGSAHGDIVRLCESTGGNYVLESNRSCPDGRKATGTTPTYSETFNGVKSNDPNHHYTNGPGGGEWFTGDDPWEQFGEGALGAVAKPGGFNKFVATQSDPANYTFFGNTTSAWSAGTRWFDAKAGTSSNGNTVYDPNQSDFTFSKAGGLGDLEALCDEAPLQIGNRVWLDENNNGIQDPAEIGLANVKVDLLGASGTVIQTTNTNPSGEYLFSNVDNDTNFTIQINYSTIPGVLPSAPNVGANDTLDSDGVTSGVLVSAGVTSHSAGDNDHNYDFGFKPVYAVGNQVFDDLDNNGIKSSSEVGVANIPVALLTSTGAPTGKTTITDVNGKYFFGYLDPGAYIVEITAPAGYISSTGDNGKLTGPNEPAPSADTAANLKIDNDDNGTTVSTTIRSSVITLGLNRAPVGETDGIGVFTPDSRNDYTVDFGIFRPASLGNRVFSDENRNGIQDTGEPGVTGVNITLYVNACGANGVAIATTSTDANGIYNFGALAGGNYFVAFQLPNGSLFTQALAGNSRTTDSNANATTGCSEIISVPAGTYDPTIDAGLIPAVTTIDLAIEKSITNRPATGSSFKPGDVVDYRLTISNNGPGTAQVGFTVSDVLPNGLTYQGSPIVQGYTCNVSGQSLSCVSNHTLGNDASETITYKAKIANTFSTSTPSLQNVAKVTPSDNEVAEDIPLSNCTATGESIGGSVTCNNVDNQSFTLPIDLKILKTIDTSKNPSYTPGSTVEYLLTITNNGPAVAKTGFTIEDTLPSELDFVSAAGTGYSCPAPNGQKIVCTSNHSLALGTTDTIRLITRIKPGLTITGQSVKNIATIKPSPSEPFGETIPLDPCSEDGTNKEDCNNRDPVSFPLPNGASLGDYVFYDLNHNGIQDSTEAGISGITVELREGTCATAVLSTATTDTDGKYVFANLVPGKTYVVKFVTKDGLVLTTQNVGSPLTDSDPNSSGCTTGIVLASGEFNSSIDAGMYRPWASIGDFVWLDANKNGIQDNNENGVAGVTVSLRNSSGSVVATTQTNNEGKYSFTQLEPGSYSLLFVTPNGYTLSSQDAGNDNSKDSDVTSNGTTAATTLAPNENDTSWDAGIFVSPASIGNFVWFDANNNGRQDSGEDPASGLTVTLYGPQCGVGEPLATTSTNADGNYLFSNLAPGTYTVKFTKPAGSSFTKVNATTVSEALDSDADTDGCSAAVTIEAGESNLDVDAGIVELATLGNYVWLDSNRNGIQDSEEIGVPGIRVVLFNEDLKIIDGKDIVTDDDGFYLFDGLLPGTYSVGFDLASLPVSMQISQANAGNDDTKDSDADPDTWVSDPVTLSAGEENLTVDAGINPIPASLGDQVWEDINKDGLQQIGEPVIEGVIVNLYFCEADASEEPLATTTTDQEGLYLFENLEPATYVVEFITPNGLTPTLSYQGEDDTIDSDVETDGFTWCVDLPPGWNERSIDAGYFDPTEPPVQVLPNRITRSTGSLPITGGQASQLMAFALSFLGAGILLTGFFTQRKKKLRFY